MSLVYASTSVQGAGMASWVVGSQGTGGWVARGRYTGRYTGRCTRQALPDLRQTQPGLTGPKTDPARP